MMVYDWETHKDVIVRLYTEEGLEVDEIIEHMHSKYNFSPRYVWTSSSPLFTQCFSPSIGGSTPGCVAVTLSLAVLRTRRLRTCGAVLSGLTHRQ